MCGRFTITLSKDDFVRYLSKYKQLEINIDPNFLPQYNIAPTEKIIAMIKHQDTYKVGTIQWGLIPGFVKDSKTFKPLINARSETLLDKISFKSSLENKRCIIFADGFYEWHNIDGKKIPYRIQLKDRKMMAFAGLWATNKNQEKPLFTATIITTEANNDMKAIHTRMPLILDDKTMDIWLNQHTDSKTLTALFKPSEQPLHLYQVSTHVNQVTHKDSKCIYPR